MPGSHVAHERMLAAPVQVQLEVVQTGGVERRMIWTRASAGTCGSAEPKTIISRPWMRCAPASDSASRSAPSAPLCSPVG